MVMKHVRELKGHKVNPANDVLRVEALDAPGIGGASSVYEISGFDGKTNPAEPVMDLPQYAHADGCCIMFQNGAINEVGVNGVTHEALITILIDRLECFQKGPYANKFNHEALGYLQAAMSCLFARTRSRVAQGVEGTLKVGTESYPTPREPQRVEPTDNPIMQYFAYGHLPDGPLRNTSTAVFNLAAHLCSVLPDGPEKSAGLRKLLEAKDCFVRASLG